MDLLVLVVVVLMLGSAVVLALCGLYEMLFNLDRNDEYVNLMTGLCLTLFSAAILICCGYSNIPFGKGEAYFVPIAFGAAGLLFLVHSLFTRYQKRKAQAQS